MREDSPLWYVHFTGNFAKPNPGRVRGFNLLPRFVGDLSAHSDNRINGLSLVQFKSSDPPNVINELLHALRLTALCDRAVSLVNWNAIIQGVVTGVVGAALLGFFA